MDSIEYRLQIAQTRSSLQKKAILKPVKAMIENDLWERTPNDNNFLSGRIIDLKFLEAFKKLDRIIE